MACHASPYQERLFLGERGPERVRADVLLAPAVTRSEIQAIEQHRERRDAVDTLDGTGALVREDEAERRPGEVVPSPMQHHEPRSRATPRSVSTSGLEPPSFSRTSRSVVADNAAPIGRRIGLLMWSIALQDGHSIRNPRAGVPSSRTPHSPTTCMRDESTTGADHPRDARKGHPWNFDRFVSLSPWPRIVISGVPPSACSSPSPRSHSTSGASNTSSTYASSTGRDATCA